MTRKGARNFTHHIDCTQLCLYPYLDLDQFHLNSSFYHRSSKNHSWINQSVFVKARRYLDFFNIWGEVQNPNYSVVYSDSDQIYWTKRPHQSYSCHRKCDDFGRSGPLFWAEGPSPSLLTNTGGSLFARLSMFLVLLAYLRSLQSSNLKTK